MMLRQAISRNGPAQALPALNPYGTAAKVVIDHLRHLLKALDKLNLRRDIDLSRSRLLHRLRALGVV